MSRKPDNNPHYSDVLVPLDVWLTPYVAYRTQFHQNRPMGALLSKFHLGTFVHYSTASVFRYRNCTDSNHRARGGVENRRHIRATRSGAGLRPEPRNGMSVTCQSGRRWSSLGLAGVATSPRGLLPFTNPRVAKQAGAPASAEIRLPVDAGVLISACGALRAFDILPDAAVLVQFAQYAGQGRLRIHSACRFERAYATPAFVNVAHPVRRVTRSKKDPCNFSRFA